jgi:ABC-2 type transport system ATP-binding protein
MLAIEIDHLVKQYRNGVRALNELNLKVDEGEIFALLGPNGAGKSTLINILTTRYQPSAGKACVLGRNVIQDPAWIRARIACVAQRISIDTHLSLMENMVFQSKLYKVGSRTANDRITNLISRFGLEPYLKYPVSSYSGGVRRRLDIAMTMVSFPKILFLDEPTVGMDAVSRNALWKMLQEIRDDYGTTIFLTTHNLEEADLLSDTICIIKNGRTLIQGTPASLRKHTRQHLIRITFSDKETVKECYREMANLPQIIEVNSQKSSLVIGVEDTRSALVDVNRWLLDQKVLFDGIAIVEPSLEDVFLRLTGSGGLHLEECEC